MGVEKDIVDYRDNLNFVFGEYGYYGGNQRYPSEHIDDYKDLVYNHQLNFGYENVIDFLQKLNSEGCTYTAFANSVFLYFRDEPELFEEIFEIPFYTIDGRPNIHALLVDFYSSMDNHNPKYFLFYKEDYVNRKEDYSAIKGSGADDVQIEWRFERYMRKHGIVVDVKRIKKEKIDKDFEKYFSRGPIVVSTRPNTLYDMNGKAVFDSPNGHAMMVTKKCENGLLMVSSWGRKYYVKPNSYEKYEYYQQVIYKDIPRSKFKRWFIAKVRFPRPWWVKLSVWAYNNC